MTEVIAAVLMLAGTAFMLIASIGLLRLPDLYMRMHAITKAGTLGIGLLLIGVAVHFADLSFTTRVVAVILFVLLTAPISAHMIGRAGYLGGVSLWRGTIFDQWQQSFSGLVEEHGRVKVRSEQAGDVPVMRENATHDRESAPPPDDPADDSVDDRTDAPASTDASSSSR